MKKIIFLVILCNLAIFFSSCKKSDATQVLPQIIFFTADPMEIFNNQPSTLSWNVSDADLVEISNIGTVANSGTITINPGVTTTYILTATNSDGANSREVTITVFTSVVGKWYVLYDYHVMGQSGYFYITFYSDGHFFSSGTSGNWEGTWSQTKNNISWIYPIQKCTYSGLVSGNTMQGTMIFANMTGDWLGTKK